MLTKRTLQSIPPRWQPTRWLGLSLAALLAPAALALEATPDQVEFKSFNDAATIAVTHNGTPVPASEISSIKLFVDQHDYDHMIVTTKSDGAVTVGPSEHLELGLYDLAINTTHGEARVRVTALQDIADEGLEARAKRQGVTVDEIRAQLGISQSVGQERITLNLPRLYYVGQSLKMDMDVKPSRTGIWTVNGAVVDAPAGGLNYTFEQPGVYDVAYVEKEGDRTIGVGLGTVTAAAEPPVRVAVKAGVVQTLMGPAGYGRYTWKLNGTDAGSDASWSGSFASPGEHTVAVRAEAPAPGTAQAFREVRFVVTVK